MDLAEWLLDRIAEDEAAARACVGINELARHINGAPIPRWVRDGMRIVSDDERRIPRVGHTWAREADHIARHDPARVLAECEAKRRIVEVRQTIDAHVRQVALTDQEEARDARNTRAGLDVALKALALPYASHADYRDEWKPRITG